jgi:hypothetical protein
LYPAIALLAVILGAGAYYSAANGAVSLWWKYVMPETAASESERSAVRVGSELRDEFRRSREKLEETGVVDFERAEEKVELLRSIDGDNGRAWYFAGEIKRVKDMAHFDSKSCVRSPADPAFNPDPYQQDFYRYLELAAQVTSADEADMSDKACYERPNGICLQRTAWIQHLLANDLYGQALAADTIPSRNAKLERAAKHAEQALKYRRPEGGQGFGQCIDTLALKQLIGDAAK